MHNIPRIQYKNLLITGDTTSGSDTITNIADTTELQAGMFIRGVGIPSGAVIDIVSATSVTLLGGVQATITDTGVLISVGFEILFDYPPKELLGEILEPNNTVSESLSGIRQVSTNYIEGKRDLIFSFLSNSIYLLLKTFIESHALYGKSFRYYEEKTYNDYLDYELNDFKINPKKITSKGENVYIWEVQLKFRRVI